MHRFFEDGVVGNENVKPQSEYLAPFSQSCSLPLDFIVRAERLQSDYHTFLELKKCAKRDVEVETSEMESSSYLGFSCCKFKRNNRNPETNQSHRNPSNCIYLPVFTYKIWLTLLVRCRVFFTMEHLFRSKTPCFNFRPDGKYTEVMSTFVNSALLQSATGSSMAKVLENNTFAYLRAFCWMSFADYVPGNGSFFLGGGRGKVIFNQMWVGAPKWNELWCFPSCSILIGMSYKML